jgi:hypothetical protein
MTSSRENDIAPQPGDGVEKTPVDARQGVQTGHVRWMLRISMFLGVVVLGSAFLWYVSVQPNANAPPRQPPAATAQTESPPPHAAS